MPIPLLVPIIGALVAAAATEDTILREMWLICIEDDEWKTRKGHIRVNFEKRIIEGDVGPFEPDSEWFNFAKITAPFEGAEIRDWFDSHLEEMEEARVAFLSGNQSVAKVIAAVLDGWLERDAPLIPGEWEFSIPDDVFDDVSGSGNHGFIDIDYKNRKVNAYSLVSGVENHYSDDNVVQVAEHIEYPISGEDVRDWFEAREEDLENARRKQLVSGNSFFERNFDIQGFRRVFDSPKGWLDYSSQNDHRGFIRDLLTRNLADMIESESVWTVAKFGPKDLVYPTVSFIDSNLRYSNLRRLIDRVDFVEGDEVLKILDEPYLFLQIRPTEPDEDDEDEEEEYEQDVRQIAEEMETYTRKGFISIQRDEGERRLPYVQIALPWVL